MIAAEELARLQEILDSEFFPSVDLSQPGLHVISADPPVLLLDSFVPREQCEQWVAAADSSGRMRLSRVGAGNADSAGGENEYNSARTSSSMLLDPHVLAAHPALEQSVKEFQAKAMRVLRTGEAGRTCILELWRRWACSTCSQARSLGASQAACQHLGSQHSRALRCESS